jgi:hypothetical protein
MFRTALAAALTVSSAGLLLAGCTASADTNPTIDKATLAQGISDTLKRQLGSPPEQVTCTGSLKNEVGQSESCMETDHGINYRVTATITSYQNGHPQYKLLVDQQGVTP